MMTPVRFLLFLLLGIVAVVDTISINSTSGASTWGSDSTWSPPQLPCVADTVVLASGANVTVNGRARAKWIGFSPGATIEVLPGATLEFPGPDEPEPFWCSAATPYPVTPPVAQAASPASVRISATLNVPLEPQSIQEAIAAHFSDSNGLPLVYSVLWHQANSSAVTAAVGSWLQYGDAEGNATGKPTDGRLAFTQSTYLASANNSVYAVVATQAQFVVVVTVSKRAPLIAALKSPQTVPWQLPYGANLSEDPSVLSMFNLTGLFIDPDGFPLNYSYTMNMTVTSAATNASTSTTWSFDPVGLVPRGIPGVFGTWLVTVVAFNNVSQSSPPFTFSAQVVLNTNQVCPNENFLGNTCVDCKSEYYGSQCQYTAATCDAHGSVVGASGVTSVCECTGNYTGAQCETSLYGNPSDFAATPLPSSTIIGIAVGASVLLLLVIGIGVLVAVRARRQRKMVSLYRTDLIASNDAMIEFSSLTNWVALSHGEYGEVSRATWADHGTLVAVKQVRADRVTNDQLSDLVQEGIKMKSLGGAAFVNIVQYYGLAMDPAYNVYLVLEYCEGGSLLNCLQESKDGWVLRPADLRFITLNVATGLEFLAKNNIVHRDVAARNVFLYKKGSVIHGKLGDLGMALSVASGSRRMGGKVPIRWCAPEVLSVGEYSTRSDVWAFGIMYWEAMSGGRRPYDDVAPSEEVAQRIRTGSILKQPYGCADEDYNLMASCWTKAPMGRPDFSAIKTILKALVERSDDDVAPADEPPRRAPPAYREAAYPGVHAVDKDYSGIPLNEIRTGK